MSLTSADDLPIYAKKDKKLVVWHVSDLEPPNPSRLSQPILFWTRENVGKPTIVSSARGGTS